MDFWKRSWCPKMELSGGISWLLCLSSRWDFQQEKNWPWRTIKNCRAILVGFRIKLPRLDQNTMWLDKARANLAEKYDGCEQSPILEHRDGSCLWWNIINVEDSIDRRQRTGHRFRLQTRYLAHRGQPLSAAASHRLSIDTGSLILRISQKCGIECH